MTPVACRSCGALHVVGRIVRRPPIGSSVRDVILQPLLVADSLLDRARESASLLEVLAKEKEQTLLIEGDGTVSVMADRTILRQALVNLIDNAVKYSPMKGEIRVRVKRNGRDAQIEVEDHGPGMSSA